MSEVGDQKAEDQPEGPGLERPETEQGRWPNLGRYIALVTLDHGGEYILPGETVELNAETGQALLALGLVEIWPGRAAE